MTLPDHLARYAGAARSAICRAFSPADLLRVQEAALAGDSAGARIVSRLLACCDKCADDGDDCGGRHEGCAIPAIALEIQPRPGEQGCGSGKCGQ